MHIHLDDVYALTVSADFWFSCGLRSGDDVDEDTLREFTANAANSAAYNKALDLLSRRDHGKKELARKLTVSAGAEAAGFAVDKLETLGLIDDNAYAGKLAEELSRRKGLSATGIRAELLRRGIEREIADNAIEGLDIDAQERIIELLNGKYANRMNDEKGKQRVYNALVRLGYAHADIRAAMRRAGTDTLD